MAPTVLQVVEKDEMIRALRAAPSLAHRFLCYMLLRNVRTEEDLIDQLSQNSEKRLARALLLLAGKGNHSNADLPEYRKRPWQPWSVRHARASVFL
jgi:CRP/FNR family cyclic AMP-dependent transcriptional regulator